MNIALDVLPLLPTDEGDSAWPVVAALSAVAAVIFPVVTGFVTWVLMKEKKEGRGEVSIATLRNDVDELMRTIKALVERVTSLEAKAGTVEALRTDLRDHYLSDMDAIKGVKTELKAEVSASEFRIMATIADLKGTLGELKDAINKIIDREVTGTHKRIKR